MNCLPTMTDEEIRYICSIIPLQDSVLYFKRYPKDFAQILPGFRPTSLKNQEQISAVLFRNRNHPFISSFIEGHISRWLDEIQREIILRTDKGESKESAWLQTLPFCFFVHNIGIFLKLIGEKHSEEYISLLSHSIRRIKDLEISSEKFKAAVSDNNLELERLKDEVKKVHIDFEKLSRKLRERSAEIKVLEKINNDLKKAVDVLHSREQDIVILENKLHERDQHIHKMNDELTTLKDEQQLLEVKIRDQLEKRRVAELIESAVSFCPKGPKDKEEFRDFLGYNLESIGVDNNADYYYLIKDYLCEILFTGKPILMSRNTSSSIMQCIGNALVGSPNVVSLEFNSDISEQKVDEFLSAKNRILCLENFIGNFNETILATICDKHRDKIIFLTIAYDRTLRFLPEEFLKYCHYLNLNRIEAFTCGHTLTEDPSSVEEVEITDLITTPNNHFATFLKEMLDEIGICSALSTYKSMLISDEARLCQMLAFDILPFCEDVLHIHPYSVSERLNRYAGDTGRCAYKELLKRWFFLG